MPNAPAIKISNKFSKAANIKVQIFYCEWLPATWPLMQCVVFIFIYLFFFTLKLNQVQITIKDI